MISSQDESTLSMFTSIVDSAVGARVSFTRSSLQESIGLLRDVAQMAKYLEQWLLDQHHEKRSTSAQDEPQEAVALSPVGKGERQEHGRALLFPHLHSPPHSQVAPISPTPNTQYSFRGQPPAGGPLSSPALVNPTTTTATEAEAAGVKQRGGQSYLVGSVSGSASRPGSRSGSESGSTFMPGSSSAATSVKSATPATAAATLATSDGWRGEGPSAASGLGKSHRHHMETGSEPHDSLSVLGEAKHSSPASGAAHLTGHDHNSRSYPHAEGDSRPFSHPPSQSPSFAVGYSGRTTGGHVQDDNEDSIIAESSLSSEAAEPHASRQRQTSLSQVPSHQSPNYPHPHHHHPYSQQQQSAGSTAYPPSAHHDRRPPSPPPPHYPLPSHHHTSGTPMASSSSISSTSSTSVAASYFGLQNASKAQQQLQYEQQRVSGTNSSAISSAQTPYSMYYHPDHYRAHSPTSPSYGYPYEGHSHHHHASSYPHPYHHHQPQHLHADRSTRRSMDEWYERRSSYHHQGHPFYYDTDRYQAPYPPPRLYTPPHHLYHHHASAQDRTHIKTLPIRHHHHSRFPRRLSQPSTTGASSALDPEGRYMPFMNDDLHEQDIRDPYAKRLPPSDGVHQDTLLSSPVPQPRNVEPSKASAPVYPSSSRHLSGSPSSSAGVGAEATTGGGNGTSLPVRGGPSTAFGGLVTTASGAPTSAVPGLVFSSRGDNLGSRTQFHAPLEPEVVARLDDIFFKFLQRICSDLKACDAKGDHIHQPLMAKKMERLEASTEFRPFKFRIQAFTNAFHDSLIMHGLTEDVLPLRKVKLYLWKHRYISRFNEDGKKQKSKGNHVWNIEARKISNIVGAGSGAELTTTTMTSSAGVPSSPSTASTPSSSTSSTLSSTSMSSASTKVASTGFYDHVPPDMDLKQIGPEAISAAGGGLGVIRRPSSPVRWEFREYSSRIAGHVIKYARVGVPYVYSPRIWDAQMSCPAAKFSSPWLPSWLKWHRGELKGIPTTGAESCTIVVVAEYVREGEECRLEMSFPLTVCDPAKEGQEHQQPQYPTSSSLAIEEGGQEGTADSSIVDGAGAVGSSTIGHDSPVNHETTSMKMQTESTTIFSKEQHQQAETEDEEMMVAVKEDEDMEDREQDSSAHNAHSNSNHHTYFSNSHRQQQQEHHREHRKAQQQLQRLQLQEHHHSHQQQQDQRDPLFQPATAPSSAGTSASFFMNPPSSRGSISSNTSSAYVDEEEFSDDNDRDHDDGGSDEEDDNGSMETTAEAGASEKSRSTRPISKTTSTSDASRPKSSRDRRSLVLSQDNKRRKHD